MFSENKIYHRKHWGNEHKALKTNAKSSIIIYFQKEIFSLKSENTAFLQKPEG